MGDTDLVLFNHEVILGQSGAPVLATGSGGGGVTSSRGSGHGLPLASGRWNATRSKLGGRGRSDSICNRGFA